MKNKSLKIFCLILFGVASFYIFKNWQVYHDKSSIDIGKLEYSQVKLNIESVQSSAPAPIWFVKTENPVVAFHIKFKNEGERSFYKTPMLLNVVLETLMEGAGNMDASELKKKLSDNSISININNSRNPDEITIDVHTVSKNFKLAVDLLSDILAKAHLKKEKIEITKQGIVTCLNQCKFSPENLATYALSQTLYEKDHPYRRSLDEDLKRVPLYTKQDCDMCYASIFSSKDAVITVAGNVTKEEVAENFDSLLKAISFKKNDFKEVSQRAGIQHQDKVVHVEIDNPHATVLFALPGFLRTTPERFAMRFANIAFGGCPFLARLFKAVRDKNGLVYGVYSNPDELDMQSYIFGAAATRPENIDSVITKIKEECAKFFEKGITKEELESFKTYIYASNVLDDTESVVNFVFNRRDDNIKLENINSYLNNYYNLTLEDVNKSIKKIFDPKNLIFITSGKSLQKKEAKNENNN